MTDTNATTLRNALAAAVKNHVEANGLSAKDGADLADVQLSRFYQVLRGEVGKISSDALVNMLGNFGYRLTGINGSGEGTEIVLSLDKAEKVLPEIDKPQQPYEVGDVVQAENGRWKMDKSGELRVVNDNDVGNAFPIGIGTMDVQGNVKEFKVVMSDSEEAVFDPDFDRVVSEDE